MNTTIKNILADINIEVWGPKVLTALIVLGISFFFVKRSKKIILRLDSITKGKINIRFINILIRLSSSVIMILGVIITLKILGIDLGKIVAGLGLFSLGLSYALRDIILNILSGATIMVYNTLKVGNYIKIRDQEGLIKNLNLRHIVIENNGEKILIPNSILLVEPLIISSPEKRKKINYS